MNLKELEESGRGLIWATISEFCCSNWETPRKTLA